MEAIAAGSAAGVLSGCGRALTPTEQARGVAPPPHSTPADTVAYHGEVWTDTRGYATVELPAEADLRLVSPLEYELRDLEPPTSARITAELKDGRFTIATDQPHVKVAWRITTRNEKPHA
jgi:hypothetical protein